jgi:hypothetical protein
MKYIITKNKLNNAIFHYLDLTLKGLVKRKPNNYHGVIFAFPDEEYGLLGFTNDNDLFIYRGLIEEISIVFGIGEYDSIHTIGVWFSDRYELIVNDVFEVYWKNGYNLIIDHS